MRILIISAWYAPFIRPRAHRWTAIAEHWASLGHEVNVVTGRRRDCPDFSVLKNVHVHRTGFPGLREWVYFFLKNGNQRGRPGGSEASTTTLRDRVFAFFQNQVWKKICFPDDACLWYLPARRKVFGLLKNQKFDLIVSVAGPFTGHLVGLAARRHFPEIRWVADSGDPFSLPPFVHFNRLIYSGLARGFEKKVIASADVFAVTTGALAERFGQVFGDVFFKKIRVIPPLLHPFLPAPPPLVRVSDPKRDVSGSLTHYFESKKSGQRPENDSFRVGDPHEQVEKNKIHLGYFGALYPPIRTPDALLDWLDWLATADPDFAARLQVHFFGEIPPPYFFKMKNQPSIRLHGLQSRETAAAAMQKMDCLLDIGNRTDYQLPSKAVDYLASGRPVLHLSYVENDPFSALFAGETTFFEVKIENEKISPAGAVAMVEFLKTEKPQPDAAALFEKIRPFLVEHVAEAYLPSNF